MISVFGSKNSLFLLQNNIYALYKGNDLVHDMIFFFKFLGGDGRGKEIEVQQQKEKKKSEYDVNSILFSF